MVLASWRSGPPCWPVLRNRRPMSAISIVVPTFNRADSLERLLCALDDQEPVAGGHEVVVVDDGSTEDVSTVAAGHPHVRLLRQANAGPAAARNRGWRASESDLVAFTDDDTIPSPTWLQDLVRAFHENPDVAAVGGEIVPVVPGFLADFVQLEGLVNHGVDMRGRPNYLVTANAAFRRAILVELGGFDESFRGASGEDADLTRRLHDAGHRVAILRTATVAHDNRTTLGALISTYRRHGSTRRQVVGAASRSDPVPEVFRLQHWTTRYSRYRAAGCSKIRSLAYLGLRTIGILAYASGVAASRLRRPAVARSLNVGDESSS